MFSSLPVTGGLKPDVGGCSRGVFLTGIWDCLFFENWWGHMWAVSPPGCHTRLTGGLKAWSHQEVQQHVSFWRLADVMTTGRANWWSTAAGELHNSSLSFSIFLAPCWKIKYEVKLSYIRELYFGSCPVSLARSLGKDIVLKYYSGPPYK